MTLSSINRQRLIKQAIVWAVNTQWRIFHAEVDKYQKRNKNFFKSVLGVGMSLRAVRPSKNMRDYTIPPALALSPGESPDSARVYVSTCCYSIVRTPVFVGRETLLNKLTLHRRPLREQIHAAIMAEFDTEMPAIELRWLMPPKPRVRTARTVARTLVERRMAAAAARLKHWTQAEKIAAGKVKKYKAKVSYYEKKGVQCD